MQFLQEQKTAALRASRWGANVSYQCAVSLVCTRIILILAPAGPPSLRSNVQKFSRNFWHGYQSAWG
ncbi:hypothetical protein, partial [Bowmanella sp. JS7-9]|uniref:hypothetical protein n=1 Tax=Bowmanella sp. JS7-9 TaxID=1605368 RepID=UPI0010E231B9